MKYFLPIIFFVFANLCFYSLSAEESLTVKQQLDRIKQEVSDLNKAVFNKSFDNNDLNLKNNQDDAERFTSALPRIIWIITTISTTSIAPSLFISPSIVLFKRTEN